MRLTASVCYDYFQGLCDHKHPMIHAFWEHYTAWVDQAVAIAGIRQHVSAIGAPRNSAQWYRDASEMLIASGF